MASINGIVCDHCGKVINPDAVAYLVSVVVTVEPVPEDPAHANRTGEIGVDHCSWVCFLRWLKEQQSLKSPCRIVMLPYLNGLVKTAGVTVGDFWKAVKEIGKEIDVGSNYTRALDIEGDPHGQE